MRQLITDHAADVSFFAPDTAYAEAREHMPTLLERRGVSGAAALACALMLGCPVWTEDSDFFGTGVATWTTSRVKLYLAPDARTGTPEEPA